LAPLLIFASALDATGCSAQGTQSRQQTEAKARALVETSIKPNCKHDEVGQWAKMNGYKWMFVPLDGGSRPRVTEYDFVVREAGVDFEKLGGLIHATGPIVQFGPTGCGYVELYFFFDKRDRLVKHYIRAVEMAS
jgi:hypothetical protein